MPDSAHDIWPQLDKQRLRASFERAAETYDEVAVLQRTIADRLLERLDVVKLKPAVILDAGCGTGYVTRALARRYPCAQRLALDIAESMVRHARHGFGDWIEPRATGQGRSGRGFGWRRLLQRRPLHVCGDAETLPLASASVDMIVSNLALQWCDAQTVFAEFRRVLRPGGLTIFTTFGPDTLRELRTAWQTVDDRPHVHGFLDMHDIGDLLVRSGFAEPVMDVERLTLTYVDVFGVLNDIKRLGAHNTARERARGLTGKHRFAHFRAAYEAMAQDGRIPATYEAVYGLAWAPASTPAPRAADGTVSVPLAQLRRRSR
ncbi:MAG TPA: malonyl-ACP O-methyltransferase BioC [Burkholderiales bacterium]|nr:malonyl-ACP O-methyltransferase BioC [Burkholderiales bacterium]